MPQIDALTERAARSFISRIATEHDLLGAILFGSRARGNFRTDSDADIAVLLRGRRGRFVATKFALDDIAYEVLLDTGVRVQPFPIWEDEWCDPESFPNPTLLRNIVQEGIRL